MGAHRSVDYDRIVRLAAQGLSQQQIAARMGCSTTTVRRALRAAGKGVRDGRAD